MIIEQVYCDCCNKSLTTDKEWPANRAWELRELDVSLHKEPLDNISTEELNMTKLETPLQFCSLTCLSKFISKSL